VVLQGQRNKSKKDTVWDSRLRTAGGSLFERLIIDEEDLDPPTDLDPLNAKVRSIKRHLVRLLNTRVGGAAASPTLGVTDFNDSTVESNDMAKHIAHSIQTCINEFEPRVSVESVTNVPDPDRPLNLQFKIITSMYVGEKKQKVQIDLLMEDGKTAQII
jgi:type VI secretion system protein